MAKPEKTDTNVPRIEFAQSNAHDCRIMPDGRQARLHVAQSRHSDALIPPLFDIMVKEGFSRAQLGLVFKNACENCNVCQSVRTNVQTFLPLRSKNLRALFNRNSRLLVRHSPAQVDVGEHVALAHQYYNARFDARAGDSSTLIESLTEFNLALQKGATGVKVEEYRLPVSDDTALGDKGALKGAYWYYETASGFAADHYYFDPENKDSIGLYMVLDNIMQAKEQNQPYVYLGPWTREPSRYHYKSRLANEVHIGKGQWAPILSS